MTSISFYQGDGDWLSWLCRLARKGYQQQRQILIYTTDAAQAMQIDHALWAFQADSFIPHALLQSPEAMHAPILITHPAETDAYSDLPHADVLINTHHEWPPFFSRFTKLLELIPNDEHGKQAARTRYSFYRDRGYPLDVVQL